MKLKGTHENKQWLYPQHKCVWTGTQNYKFHVTSLMIILPIHLYHSWSTCRGVCDNIEL